ncbi:hypothetical protein PGTUg99_027485 [Puccinia graminis f. sp. tritici]|uniref:hAT-like transposase RNase-H fold domain-containing protein n=1 Tax=Puccinia graminis f. sp. tritici TaxID=56615 RepID=A0A5B0S0L2_PUCGR|nr:hypothetical protein PGTUg99_027485 [Puccinia graminis f. sp. tritici]
MALVVNAGLTKLGIEAPPPPKIKKAFLGSFPYSTAMAPITEAEEEENTADQMVYESDCDDNSDTEDSGDDEIDMVEEDEESEAAAKGVPEKNEKAGGKNKNKSAANRNQSNELNELTKAITSSSAWRQEFDRRAEGKDLKGLIAGYGIRWNIKYQSRMRAYNAREVIDAMLQDEYVKYQDQISRLSRKENRKKLGHFKEIQFTAKEWRMIDELNQELKVRGKLLNSYSFSKILNNLSFDQPFDRLTKIMEGDGPTGAFVLPNYYQMIKDLKKKEEGCDRGHALHPMYVKMIEKLQTYQDEALKCETLVMATILHPSFRLNLFTHCWPESADMAKKLLERHFKKRDELLRKKKEDNNEISQKKPETVDEDNIFELFNAAKIEESKELEVYVKNMD